MKDRLDQAIAHANGAIDRLREGRLGAAGANMWLSSWYLDTWADGLCAHASASGVRLSATDRMDMQEDLHVGHVPPRLAHFVAPEQRAKFKYANERYLAALKLSWAVDANVENAAGRSKRKKYLAFRANTEVFKTANGAVQRLRTAGIAREGQLPQLRDALRQRAAAVDAWLESPEGAFAQACIQKFRAGVKVEARFGDEACDRCGGAGFIAAYAHIDGGVCYDCGGTGVQS